MSVGEHLAGGSGGVWKYEAPDGSVRVHRPTGPWTPAVHELLGYLHDRGLDGVPEVFGFDGEGREVLSYLPGDSLDPELGSPHDRALEAAAAWLRRFHDLVATFEPAHTTWRSGDRRRGPGDIICHNDPGVANWVVVDGAFAGMIDWDRAGPGAAIDDLAFLSWSAVPLMRAIDADEAARRITLVAQAYGDVHPTDLLTAVTHRMELISQRWRLGIERGDPGTLALRDAGVMSRHHDRVAAYVAREEHIRRALEGAA